MTILDSDEPEANVTSTSTLKSGTQTLTLTCTDNVGVTKWYFGTSASPAESAFTTISSNTNWSKNDQTVNAAGTYYLVCKDAVGNTSTSTSITYNSYTVSNRLVSTSGNETVYTSANFAQASTNTYIAPSGTTIDLDAIYTVPTNSNSNHFIGVSSGAASTTAATLLTQDPVLSTNTTYTAWFTRNMIIFNYMVRYDETLSASTTANDGTVYTWTTDEDNLVLRSVNGDTPALLTSSYRVGVTKHDLADYNNTKYLNITKPLYSGVASQQWICESGCKTAGQTFSHSNVTANFNNYCDNLETQDCHIIVGVNWTYLTYTIGYTMYNGTLGASAPTSAQYESVIKIDNPTKTVTITGDANGTGATVGSPTSASQTFTGWTANTALTTTTAMYGTTDSNVTTPWSNRTTKVTNVKC